MPVALTRGCDSRSIILRALPSSHSTRINGSRNRTPPARVVLKAPSWLLMVGATAKRRAAMRHQCFCRYEPRAAERGGSSKPRLADVRQAFPATHLAVALPKLHRIHPPHRL